MPSRYLSCSLHYGRFYIAHIGSPERAEVSYWTPEMVAKDVDERLDRVVDTLAQLDAVQRESFTRPVPIRMVFGERHSGGRGAAPQQGQLTTP